MELWGLEDEVFWGLGDHQLVWVGKAKDTNVSTVQRNCL